MQEALVLFNSVINGQFFKNKPIILFLNMMDLFKDKLTVWPLSEHFPGFEGASTDPIQVAAAGYFDHRFREADRGRGSASGRQIYTHYITAIDTELMKQTLPVELESVHNSIFIQNFDSLV